MTAKSRLCILSSWKRCRRCSTERTRSFPAYCPPQKQRSSFTAIHSFNAVSKKATFTINDLKHFKYPVSLYLVVPPSDIERLKPLLRLIFTMTVNRLTEELEEVRNSKLQQDLKPGETFKARPDHRILLLIDEFPTLGKMPIFQTAFAYIAGYGIKAYLITQDIEQMKDTYGNHESIISNCHIRIAFAPNKTETAEALSKMAGTATILRAAVSYSGSRTSPLATNVSTNVDHISRPLITVDELMRLPGPVKEGQGEAQRIIAPGAMLIFIAGQSPIFGKQLLYFQDPYSQQKIGDQAAAYSLHDRA